MNQYWYCKTCNRAKFACICGLKSPKVKYASIQKKTSYAQTDVSGERCALSIASALN